MAKRRKSKKKKQMGCMAGLFHFFTMNMFRHYRTWNRTGRNALYQPAKWGVID